MARPNFIAAGGLSGAGDAFQRESRTHRAGSLPALLTDLAEGMRFARLFTGRSAPVPKVFLGSAERGQAAVMAVSFGISFAGIGRFE
jgi:hypothetical protein